MHVKFGELKVHSLSPRGRFRCRHLHSRDIAEHSVAVFHDPRDPRPHLSRLPGVQPVHLGFGPRLRLFGPHRALCRSRTVAFNVELRLGGRSGAHVWHPEFGSAHRRVRADLRLLDDLIPEHLYRARRPLYPLCLVGWRPGHVRQRQRIPGENGTGKQHGFKLWVELHVRAINEPVHAGALRIHRSEHSNLRGLDHLQAAHPINHPPACHFRTDLRRAFGKTEAGVLLKLVLSSHPTAVGLPRPRHSDQLHSDHLQLHIDGLQQPANPEPGSRHLVYKHIRLECGRHSGPQVK